MIKVATVRRPERSLSTQIFIFEILRGLGITLRHFFVNMAKHAAYAVGLSKERGDVTIRFPDVPAMLGLRARTRHRLLKRDDGTPRCTACMCCETICPAKCIHIVAENSPEVIVEKRAKSFDIDLGLCIFCGYCVEACPVDAIHMDANNVELAAYSRKDMIWNMQELLGDKKK